MLDIVGVDGLYDLDRGAFVAARDELAKQLRGSGDRDGAAAVKALRRPTVVAWSINRVARNQPKVVGALLDATDAVRRAQPTGADALRTASRDRRDALQQVAKAAVALAGDAHAIEVAATLEAASLDEALGPLLRSGRLERELSAPSTFDLAFGAGLPARPAPDDDDELAAARARHVAAQVAAVARADEAAAAAHERVEVARRALATAEADLAAAISRQEASRAPGHRGGSPGRTAR